MNDNDDGNGLRITVLGCSGTYASTESACSGYLVQSSTTSVVLDAGPGPIRGGAVGTPGQVSGPRTDGAKSWKTGTMRWPAPT